MIAHMLVYLSAQRHLGCLNHGVNFIENARIFLCGSALNILFIINQQRRIIGMNRKGTNIFSWQTSHGNNLEYEMIFPQC
jgi:hypothetical protein